jgi:hypothetical protein
MTTPRYWTAERTGIGIVRYEPYLRERDKKGEEMRRTVFLGLLHSSWLFSSASRRRGKLPPLSS